MAELKPFEIKTKVGIVGIVVLVAAFIAAVMKLEGFYKFLVPNGVWLNWRFVFSLICITGLIVWFIMNEFWKNEYEKHQQARFEVENLKNQLNASEKRRMTDIITGIPNSSMLHEDIKEFAKTKTQNKEVQLILIDIKKFKAINKKYGYLKGDKIIRLIAQSIYKSMRRNEDMYKHSGFNNEAKPFWKRLYRRYPGGDEFVFLIEGNQAEAIGFVNRLVNQFSSLTNETLEILGEKYPLSFCCGISPLVYNDKFEDALERVEDCFMRASEGTRDFSICWHPALEEERIATKEEYKNIYDRARQLFEVINMEDKK
jgi:GGDEF domain-containing protein